MQFKIGDTVRKTKGSKWQGKIVGQYSTELTPNGYAVESDTENGSVQIYPASALELAVSMPTKKVAKMNSQVLVDRDLLQELASFCSDSRSYNEIMRVLAASAPISDAEPVRTMVVPDGWRLVPVEMSDEMHAAYLDQYGRGLGIYWIYKALLAASPAPGGGQ